MAKITTKAGLILGTNYKYHLVDFQGVDIVISNTNGNITSTTTDFTASTEVAGVVKRPVRVGDVIQITNTGNSANEGLEATVTAVAANTLTVTFEGVAVDEAAGADINITAFVKEWEFLEAGGLSFIDGVDGIVWASKTVDDWDTGNLDIYPRIFTSIEPRAKSMAQLNGWRPLNTSTVNSIRGTALERRDDANASASQIYALFRSGNLDETTDQFFVWSSNEPEMDAPTAAVMQGYIDQPFLIYDRDVENNQISGVTQANPAVVTLPSGHTFANGDKIEVSGVAGMTQLNGNTYTVANSTATTIELEGVDSTGFGAYTSGGVVAVDNRGEWNFRCLEPGKTHLQGTIDALFAEIYPVPSNNGIDPKLADGTGTQLVSDATVGAGGIYANILLYEDVDSQYDGDVDSVLYSFLGYVDADSQTNQTVHTKIHYILRQPTDINSDGTGRQIRGDKAPPITSFLGEQMTVDQYYLLNFNLSERNDLRLVDDSGNTQSWPTILTITITSPTIALTGTFSLIHKDTYGLSSVTYLQDEGSVSQQDIAIGSSVSIVVAYSTYNVDGHTPGTPLDLVLTWNRPGFIEPDFNDSITLSGSDITVPITPTADPSYTAA